MHKKFKILGKVQGVFFRKSTQERAGDLNLKGWVRNEEDGSVIVFIQGGEQEVQQMAEWLKHGPETADVQQLLLLDEGYDQPCKGFEII